MTPVDLQTVADIKPGMKFTIPDAKDTKGNDCPFNDEIWVVVGLIPEGTIAPNGTPISNRLGNKFYCKTGAMEKPLMMCFDSFPTPNVKF